MTEKDKAAHLESEGDTKLQDSARPLGASGDGYDVQHGNAPLPCDTESGGVPMRSAEEWATYLLEKSLIDTETYDDDEPDSDTIFHVIRCIQQDALKSAGQRVVVDVLKIIKETLDAPTFIDPVANCKNLTKTLQQIERILS